MKDKIVFDGRYATVTKANGNTYIVASYNNANVSHRRGAFVLGSIPSFRLSIDTMAHVLKYFYPNDSLAYLKKYGYIAS